VRATWVAGEPVYDNRRAGDPLVYPGADGAVDSGG
jgi:guanine deaminase